MGRKAGTFKRSIQSLTFHQQHSVVGSVNVPDIPSGPASSSSASSLEAAHTKAPASNLFAFITICPVLRGRERVPEIVRFAAREQRNSPIPQERSCFAYETSVSFPEANSCGGRGSCDHGTATTPSLHMPKLTNLETNLTALSLPLFSLCVSTNFYGVFQTVKAVNLKL